VAVPRIRRRRVASRLRSNRIRPSIARLFNCDFLPHRRPVRSLSDMLRAPTPKGASQYGIGGSLDLDDPLCSMIDDRHFPLVFLNCPRDINAEFIVEFERGFEALFARKQKFVMICDLSAVGKVPDALTRKKLADVLNRSDFKDRQAAYQVGSANLVDSAPIRAALTALLWIWHPPSPMTAPPTRAEAVKWGIERLREAGAHVPASLEAFAVAEGARPASKWAAR
jgi:hypothetical protein